MKTRISSRHSRLLAAAAAFLWSSAGLLVRLINADEITVIFWRSLSATLLLGLYLGYVRRLSIGKIARRLGWPGLGVAVFLSIDAFATVLAFSNTSVANANLIFSVTPFVVAGIAWMWLREAVTMSTLLAAGLCAIGVVTMVSSSLGKSAIVGDAYALCAVLAFAIAIVLIRRYPHTDMLAAVWVSSLIAAVCSFPFATPLGHEPIDYTLMVTFGAVEYALAAVLFTLGARYLPAAQASLIVLLEVPLGPLWVWLLLNEVPGNPTLLGGCLILVTLVVYTLHDLRLGGELRQASAS